MAALSKERNTSYRDGHSVVHGVAAGAVIFAGALVCVNATGYLVPGSVSTTLKAVGRAEETADNTGGIDNALQVPIRKGVFNFANAGDVTLAHVETDVYINDDQTVSSVVTGKSVAGKCIAVDSDGVWVQFK